MNRRHLFKASIFCAANVGRLNCTLVPLDAVDVFCSVLFYFHFLYCTTLLGRLRCLSSLCGRRLLPHSSNISEGCVAVLKHGQGSCCLLNIAPCALGSFYAEWPGAALMGRTKNDTARQIGAEIHEVGAPITIFLREVRETLQTSTVTTQYLTSSDSPEAQRSDPKMRLTATVAAVAASVSVANAHCYIWVRTKKPGAARPLCSSAMLTRTHSR